MSAHLAATTSDGVAMELVSFDGKRCVLHSTRAFAPGNPLRLRVSRPEGPVRLDLKSIGSRRVGDDTFEVRANITTIPAHVRDALVAHFGARQAP